MKMILLNIRFHYLLRFHHLLEKLTPQRSSLHTGEAPKDHSVDPTTKCETENL